MSIASAEQFVLEPAVVSLVPMGVALWIAAFALGSRTKSELAADVAAAAGCGVAQVSAAIGKYLREDPGVSEPLCVRRLASVAGAAS